MSGEGTGWKWDGRGVRNVTSSGLRQLEDRLGPRALGTGEREDLSSVGCSVMSKAEITVGREECSQAVPWGTFTFRERVGDESRG